MTKIDRLYGKEERPALERGVVRLIELSLAGGLRLCDYCFRRRKRCHDVRRQGSGKNWKSFRARRFK